MSPTIQFVPVVLDELPTLAGTVIDVVTEDLEAPGVEVIERFIRLEDSVSTEEAVWLSTADHIAWTLSNVEKWWLVSVPLAAVGQGIVEYVVGNSDLRAPVLENFKNIIGRAVENMGRDRG